MDLYLGIQAGITDWRTTVLQNDLFWRFLRASDAVRQHAPLTF